MKFQSSIASLKEALDLASKAVAERSTLPVLAMVLIEAQDEWVTVKATNLELGIVTRFPAEIDESFSVCIPFKTLNDYTRGLGQGDVTVSLNPKTVTVTLDANGFKSNVKSLDAGEFPQMPEFTNAENTFTLSTGVLVEALTRVVFSASDNDGRPVLHSVYFQIEKKQLALASADGFRLSVYNSIKAPKANDGKYLVPLASAEKLLGIAKQLPHEDEVTIKFNPQNVYFSWESGLGVFSALVEGNFPDFNQIIPKKESFVSHITLSRNALGRAITLSNVFARESANTVQFDARGTEDGREFRILAASKEMGDSDGLVDAQIEGEPVRWALNSEFVEDFCRYTRSDLVAFHLVNWTSAVKMEEVGNDRFTYIVMPMNIGK